MERECKPYPVELSPVHGVTVLADKVPILCAFLFETNAKVAIINCIVADPSVEKEVRSDALDLLIETSSDLAKHLGYEQISASTNLEGLIERYKKHGFEAADTGVTHLGRKL